MRKISSIFVLLATILVAGTGCLKDKGFEDQQYGIQIKEVKGVAFPQAASSPIGIGVFAIPTSQTVQGPYITLEESGAPGSDVDVTVGVNNALITDPHQTVLDPSLYSISTLNVKIPAGQTRSDIIKITIPDGTKLDPSKTYAIGLSLKTASSGYQLAANQKDVVVTITVRSKYDGIYSIAETDATFRDAQGPANTGAYPKEIHLITMGPNSVAYFDPKLNNGSYAYRFLNAGAGSYYGNFGPVFHFDAAGNVIDVTNHPDYAGNTQNRSAKLDPTGVNKATFNASGGIQSINVSYIMVQAGVNRVFITEKFVFQKARP